MRFVASLLHILVAAALLLTVSAISGRPSVFPDTAYYYSQGEAFAARLGLVSAQDAAASQRDPTSVLANNAQPSPTPLDAMLAARAPTYGVGLYAASRLGGLWLVIGLQALVAATVLLMVTRAVLGGAAIGRFYGLVGMLTLGSSLPFLVGFAMPDLFAGLGLLSATVLLAYADRMGRRSQIGLSLITAFSVACHSTHLTVILVVLIGGLVLTVLSHRRTPRLNSAAGAGLVALAMAGGMILAAIADQAASTPGHPQRHPPFITARLLADGPGRIYLRKACANPSSYALCAYQHEPLDKADDVLWSTVPSKGVFILADNSTRVALEREQLGFVLHTWADQPAASAVAALGNAGRQLIDVMASDELRNNSNYFQHPILARTRLPTLIPHAEACHLPMHGCASRLPYDLVRIDQQTVILLAICLIAWIVSRPGFRTQAACAPRSAEARLLRLIALVTLAILANAAVCGALSGPFDRYGARLIWLVPTLGWLAFATRLQRKSDPLAV